MAVIREPMDIAFIPNTTMNKMIVNDIHNGYEIQAVDGYVLHDSRIDMPEIDDNGIETGNIIPWFKVGSTTVPLSYDFGNVTSGAYTYTDENGMTVNVSVEKIGMYEFYTLPEDIAPTSQI